MGGASTKAGRRPNHMCINNTPVEHYPELGLYVKREDLCCPVGPHFSKTRGVYAHIAKRPESLIGCLDTSHSQGGWATAQACKMLGKRAIVYRPVTVKMRRDGSILKLAPQQQVAEDLGATIVDLQAGRSAVLYHSAKKHLYAQGRRTYMMPNALKLPEMIEETAAEFFRTEVPKDVKAIVVSASSATIASGVYQAVVDSKWDGRVIVHMGYARPTDSVMKYMHRMSGRFVYTDQLVIIEEDCAYGDEARPGPTPAFPCNKYYDLKAFRWWAETGRDLFGKALLWNIG
jgi:threonine dehydratase